MRLPRLLGIAATLVFAGCSGDIGAGSQFSGQRCLQESDCAPGLTCHDRICVPLLDSTERDAGDDGEDASGPDAFNNSMTCEPGARWCRDIQAAQVCTASGTVETQPCPETIVCVDGACVPNGPECIDEDGDGYGVGCNLGPDCDDTNPDVFPNRPEECGNGIDDNCDGRIDERCMMSGGCCEGGCGPEQFCSNACECTTYDPAVCTAQDQPCQFEGEVTNGFYCVNLSDTPRCWGLCEVGAANPDATCPEPGSVCAFPTDDRFGLCATPCGEENACGADGMGCLPWDNDAGDGVCLPASSGELHDACDPDIAFSCGEGLYCVALDAAGGGRCEQACRPFAHDGSDTDCREGTYCLPFAGAVGVCLDANNASEGEACGPFGSMCDDDAVACYDLGGGQTCTRFCRFAEGDADCGDGECTPYDPQSIELGYCR